MTGMWLRLEWRRRGRSAVVLALMIAFALATVLTAVAGARRGLSAYERLAVVTKPATITVLPNDPGFDWDRVRAMPEVEAVGTFVVSGFALEDPATAVAGGMPPGDDQVFIGTEVPVLLAGRLFDRSRIDEVVVSPKFVELHGRGVGDRVTMRLGRPEEVGPTAGDVPFTGPRVEATIVGVIRTPWWTINDGQGGVMVSPALVRRYEPNFLGAHREGYVNALVRLRGGAGQIEAFKKSFAALTGRSDIDIWDNSDSQHRLARLIAFESACLLAFGLAAFVAAVVLIGQSVARYTAVAEARLRTLRAVGMTPRQAIGAATLLPLLAALAGAAFGVAAALVASRWTPMGTASAVEPTPGFDADWPVLGLGAALTVLLVTGGAAVLTWLALRAAGAGRRSEDRSAVVAAAARLGMPVPVVVGARFALERGRGPDALPVRPALLSAVVGVLGVIAAFMFSSGVDDAGSNPLRYGQNFQLTAFLGIGGQSFGDPEALLGQVAADPEVDTATVATIGVAQAGATSVTLWGVRSHDHPWEPVLSEGAAPRGDREIMLAIGSARHIGVGVGDDLTLTGPLGPQTFRVSGLGFIPAGPHNGYEEGGVVGDAGYDRLFPPGQFKFMFGLVTVKDGADPLEVMARVNTGFPPGQGLFPPDPPEQLAQMRVVEPLPIALAVFLGLLALGAVAHALVTAVRRRGHEMAVLRACGLTGGQARGVVLTQATVLALTGLLFGVPLGFVVGRALWGVVADTMPFFYHPPLAVLALLLIGPVTLLAANLLAVWPARLSTRSRVGHVLRTE
ncbi:FtsX-like permease family protein [Herbidospora sp. NEAU-GS84]|uniref:FtsX-like permease family protein n=1 Tax=Herbidospora solisilvae TaxID=2696284 RepID=A0A7C9NHT6_9ACTN|nr:ABC transporter permease [Herbidospora solisilvae]NAS22932.1 FtsX-like permease family protein [Herbidospora solisilvae]